MALREKIPLLALSRRMTLQGITPAPYCHPSGLLRKPWLVYYEGCCSVLCRSSKPGIIAQLELVTTRRRIIPAALAKANADAVLRCPVKTIYFQVFPGLEKKAANNLEHSGLSANSDRTNENLSACSQMSTQIRRLMTQHRLGTQQWMWSQEQIFLMQYKLDH